MSWSVFNMTHIITKGYPGVSGLGSHLGLWWMSKGCTDLAPPLTSCSTQVGPVPHLGSTVELALDVGVAGEPTQVYEYGRAGPASCLLGSSAN